MTRERLASHLSVDPLRNYVTAADSDLDAALILYQWNCRAAAVFFESLGHGEVLLRTAMHDQLTVWHTRSGRAGHWYDDPAHILPAKRRDDIAKARHYLARHGVDDVPGQVVAQLTFGFWRFLLDAGTQTLLWAPAIQHAFPHLIPRRRATVYNLIDPLYGLRNRIAHHEPVHNRPLQQRYDQLLELVGYIDPGLSTWLDRISQVPAALATRP